MAGQWTPGTYPFLLIQCRNHRHTLQCQIYMSVGDLNLGLYACVANTDWAISSGLQKQLVGFCPVARIRQNLAYWQGHPVLGGVGFDLCCIYPSDQRSTAIKAFPWLLEPKALPEPNTFEGLKGPISVWALRPVGSPALERSPHYFARNWDDCSFLWLGLKR